MMDVFGQKIRLGHGIDTFDSVSKRIDVVSRRMQISAHPGRFRHEPSYLV